MGLTMTLPQFEKFQQKKLFIECKELGVLYTEQIGAEIWVFFDNWLDTCECYRCKLVRQLLDELLNWSKNETDG